MLRRLGKSKKTVAPELDSRLHPESTIKNAPDNIRNKSIGSQLHISDITHSPKFARKRKPLSKDDGKKQTNLEKIVLGGESDVLKNLEVQLRDAETFPTKKSRVNIHESQKTPAWVDDDDLSEIRLTNFQKNLIPGKTEKIEGDSYIHTLKSRFENVSGTPNWASKRVDDINGSDEDSDAEDLKKTTGNCLVSSKTLPKGTIEMKRCTDANRESVHGAKLKCLEFHPSAQVLLTAGMDYRLSLFQVDGKNNPHIQSTYITNFPIVSAHFSTDGCEVIVGSKHPGFCYYDMMVGRIVKVPRIKALEEPSMRFFEVSPDGRFLAFQGSYGFIHLLSAKSKEWIRSLKMNGNVTSLAFTKDGSKLYSHGEDGQVYVWDMRARDCIHQFYDDGCIHGTRIAVSNCARYLACGSNTGVVNLYDAETCMASSTPRPLRAVMNLTTSCTSLRFNATSEILAMSSKEAKCAVKLLHIPSRTVFSNFPEQFMDKDLNYPICLDFSLNSGFLSVGTNKGQALLYRLKHYGNY